jgi:lipoic acid synthetase
MVDRDDLLDGGAEHVAKTVSPARAPAGSPRRNPSGRLRGRLSDVETVVDAGPDVSAHNVGVRGA